MVEIASGERQCVPRPEYDVLAVRCLCRENSRRPGDSANGMTTVPSPRARPAAIMQYAAKKNGPPLEAARSCNQSINFAPYTITRVRRQADLSRPYRGGR